MLKNITPYKFFRAAFYSHQTIVIMIFFLSVTAAALLWTQSTEYYNNQAERYFEDKVHETLDHIEKRILRYENALLGGIAYLHGSNNVSREEWHNYVMALQTEKYYPGFQGIGFAVMLNPEEVDPFINKIRTDDYVSFTLKPEGKREQYSTILYLEPMNDRNIEAIGYDMFSDPTRRKAMERARDTGLSSVSGKVTLVQEIDADMQAGFLMYLPLYKTKTVPKTIEQRREALLGFVYSPFRMNDLMSTLLHTQSTLLNFEIYDGTNPSDENLLYSTKSSDHITADFNQSHRIQSSTYISKYRYQQKFNIGGREWHIHFSSTPEFDADIYSSYPLLLTLGGLFVYFLLLFIVIALFYNRQKLKQQTKELELNRSWLSTLLDSSIDGIHLMNIDGKLIDYSPSFLKMLGYNEKEASDLSIYDWEAEHSQEFIDQKFSSMTDTPVNIETLHKRKDGTLLNVDITTRRIMLGNTPYIYASARNITERKKKDEAFRELSLRNKAILDSVPDIIMQISTDHKYIWANYAGMDFFGKDVIGKDISTYFTDKHKDTCAALNTIFEQNDQVMYLEQWHRRKDGENRLLALWCRPIHDDTKNKDEVLFAAQDITEHKKAETELHKLSQAVEQSPNTVVIANLEGEIEYVNSAFTKTTGYTPEEAIGQNARFLQSGKTSMAEYEDMWAHLTQGKSWSGEFINKRKDKTEYVEAVKASPIFNDKGIITNYMAIKEDITKQKHTQERIHHLANYDLLTGLPNRSQLEEKTKYAIDLSNRQNGKLSMLFLDIDRFKDINDTLGHNIGDMLLIQLAKRFRSILRKEDIVSRLGGDEFIFMLPHTDERSVSHVSRKLLKIISKPIVIEKNELIVTASIGIAIYPTDGTDYQTLSKNADIAMYRAKHQGRNNYCFYTEAMQARSIRNLELTNALHQALKRNELYLVYQPQISLQDNRIVGAEALLRWSHPTLGDILPSEFIPLAEESGLILSIGEWVLRTAIQEAKNWNKYSPSQMIISVNLSAVQFRHHRLQEMIKKILNEHELEPKYLELELTEAVTMHDPKNAYIIMDRLHTYGIRLSIDDFGTGYSSLSYLKKFKVYKLKIDQSFIRDIHKDPEDKAIVNAIINMAHSLGVKTIAEGVETIEQLKYLQEQGCDEIQGYYYSEPLSDKEFELFVKKNIIKSTIN